MVYRLFASDFDDTLVPIGRDLSAPNRAAIRRVRDAGIRFAIASGRCSYGLLANARRHGIDIPGLYLIGFNGAEVSQAWDGRPICSMAGCCSRSASSWRWPVGRRGLRPVSPLP